MRFRKPCLFVRDPIPCRRSNFERDKQPRHPAASAAACSSPPAPTETSPCRGRRGTGTCAPVSPIGAVTAIATVPTGFSGVPPPGPAMPVMPMPTSDPGAVRRSRRPSRCATGSLTAPCAAISALGHAEPFDLRAIAVADGAAIEIVGAAGHVGQPRRQQSARARLGDRDRQSLRSQQIADRRLRADGRRCCRRSARARREVRCTAARAPRPPSCAVSALRRSGAVRSAPSPRESSWRSEPAPSATAP